ncbi:MAG: (Fe-S)-binding protein [Chitinophagaceae bacterium]
MNVHIFVPCFVDQLYPQVAFNMIKILEKLGCNVIYNANQTCCGQPAFNAGFWGESKEVCSKFMTDFADADYIVAPSASCIGFLRNYYPKLFDTAANHKEIVQLGKKSFELSDFIVNVLKVTNVGATFHGKVTYHDSCAALRECGLKKEPRILLENVVGLELVEMQDNETCCGFGGTFAVKFEPISIAMADQKITNASTTEAEYIISTDMSCLMHIDGRIKNKNAHLKVLHIADVLANF